MFAEAASVLAIAAALFWATPAHSQSCGPNEIQSGGASGGYILCTPMEAPPASVSLENPGPQWSTRWGAIAFDNVDGKFGGIDGLHSQRSAQKAAVKECKKSGGKKCKVLISYYHQCGVLASGDNYTMTSRGPDVNETAQRAVNLCSEKPPNCKPYYAGCSYPVRVR